MIQLGRRLSRLILAVAAIGLLGAAVAQELPDIELETVVEGLISPVTLTSPPDDDRRFVVDRRGFIYVLQPDGTVLREPYLDSPMDRPFLDISDRLIEFRDRFDERGLLGLAFHPNYQENGRYFVYYSAPLREGAPDDWDHTAVISEFKATQPEEGLRSVSNTTDMDSERILLQVDQPQFNHNGGAIAFGPDGYLYIALGDGGAANDVALGHPPMGHGQDITSLLGSILRIDVDRGWPGYAVPQDNPFVGDPRGRDEIHSWGWRNPYRMSFDMSTGDLYVASNGQNLWEAVYEASDPGNYGWNILEGTHCFDPQNPSSAPPPTACPSVGPHGYDLELPVIEYPHLQNQGESPVAGISVIGGYMYRGSAIPELQGHYVFGDWSLSFSEPNGQIFVANPGGSKVGGELWDVSQLRELDLYVLGFGQDSAGELYVLTTETTGPTGETGAVHKIVPATEGSSSESDGAADDGSAGDTEGEMPVDDTEGEMPADDTEGDANASGSDSGAMAASSVESYFTTAQAERGQALYGQHCQECHGDGFQGGAGPFPALTGDSFFATWEGRPLEELRSYVRENMPLGAAGSLDDQTYTDILAYWLSEHGYASGSSELPVDLGDLPETQVEDRSN